MDYRNHSDFLLRDKTPFFGRLTSQGSIREVSIDLSPNFWRYTASVYPGYKPFCGRCKKLSLRRPTPLEHEYKQANRQEKEQ
jgi:hypothetical protein